jgi:hypothetical protein
MRLNKLCSMDLTYTDGFTLIRPYGGESGLGWGVGTGTVDGDRLRGTARWSNHPARRGDGAMLPAARGVIETEDGAKVTFDLTGRTVFVDRDGVSMGRQLLLCLFESQDEAYLWLNNSVCVVEGAINAETLVFHLEVHECLSELD